ncbi:hypothetical protein TWF694_010024 [Orbilia ellipsospora]|uniref:Phosphatidylinositol-specific phospholipase C X domain-containing protein n=1 Tax=Orbilia ellipsospora TaxID=2528407 RepID=A0AAV9XBA2_9PEZI
MGKFTTRSHLEFVNLTGNIIRIYGEDGDDYDWDDAEDGKDLRPDRNFREVEIQPFQRALRDCETSNAAGIATIHMRITNVTGEAKDTWALFSGDQKNAFASGKGIFGTVQFEKANPPGFIIYQVAHSSFNRFLVVPSESLANWMSRVEGSRDLFELIIPGTHGSACLADGGGSKKDWTQDKKSTIWSQLAVGIRAFDLRFESIEGVEGKKGDIISVHGVNDVKYSPQKIFKEIFDFLQSHPSEFVFARIRGNADVAPKLWEAFVSGGATADFVYGAIPGADGNHGHITNLWPNNLDGCRGKLLIQTEGSLKDSLGGLESPGWSDNTSDQTIRSGGVEGLPTVVRAIRVQDNHTFAAGTRTKKWNLITAMLRNQETSDKYSKWYFNFLNASGNHDPKYWAKGEDDDWGMNRRLLNYWAENTFYTSGIMWMDYYDEPEGLRALVAIMAAMNSETNKHSVR